eukprot:14523542-Alexandrium_andersonii.AAC.1
MNFPELPEIEAHLGSPQIPNPGLPKTTPQGPQILPQASPDSGPRVCMALSQDLKVRSRDLLGALGGDDDNDDAATAASSRAAGQPPTPPRDAVLGPDLTMWDSEVLSEI